MANKRKKPTDHNVYLYGKKPAQAIPAKGTQGFLIRHLDGNYFFRIYGKSKNDFTDYEIGHFDLEIKIMDSDSAFYKRGKKLDPILDHSPQALGLTRKNEAL